MVSGSEMGSSSKGVFAREGGSALTEVESEDEGRVGAWTWGGGAGAAHQGVAAPTPTARGELCTRGEGASSSAGSQPTGTRCLGDVGDEASAAAAAEATLKGT